jgi:integral membrane sensor domain MASE1
MLSSLQYLVLSSKGNSRESYLFRSLLTVMFAIQIGAGILPPVLVGIVAYVTYVVIGVLCGKPFHNPALNNTD